MRLQSPRWRLATTAGSSLLCVLSACPMAAAQAPLSEESYAAQVLAAGLDAKVAEAEAALARADTAGAGLWPNPSLEWERQPNPTEDRVVGGQHVIVASIPLVLSGRLGLESESVERGVAAAEARRTHARSALRRDAALAFSAVLAATERRALLERSLSTLDELTRIIEAREKAGEAAGYDRARIVLERAVVADLLGAAMLEERRAKAEALSLLGPSHTQLPPFVGALAAPRPMPDGAQLLQELGVNRSDLEALRLEEQSAGLAERAAGRSWIPEPTVNAGALLLEGARSGAGAGFVVGLSIPVPLFDHGQGPRARAGARQRLAAAQHERLLLAARKELVATLDALALRTERRERHLRDVVGGAEELRAIATAGYRGGSVELLALVDAERVARDAGLTAVELSLEVTTAQTELSFISGAYDAALRSSP